MGSESFSDGDGSLMGGSINHAYPPAATTIAATAKNLASGGSVPPRPSFQNLVEYCRFVESERIHMIRHELSVDSY